MTVRKYAELDGIQPQSLQKKLKRKGLGVFGLDEKLPEDVIKKITGGLNGSSVGVSIRKEGERRGERARRSRGGLFVRLFQMLPLPMLGLAASYGVYFFASQFVPIYIAVIEACAFELTYIGLASMKGLNKERRSYARKVSVGAVVVSIIYNTISAAMHQDPNLLDNLNWFWFWVLSVLHGAPLALLGYFMADLNFITKEK